MRPADRLIAGLICVAVASITLASSGRQGITRDEAYYMRAGERYVRYYEDVLSGTLRDPFSAGSIQQYWSYNSEHPPLLKILYGVSWRVLHGYACAPDQPWPLDAARVTRCPRAALAVLPEVAAFRLPAAVIFGLLCALVYAFFLDALGSRRGALTAALLMFVQPRAFFHAQTAALDLPSAALWFATTVAYWRALRAGSWRSAVTAGLLFGLFLATKLQSFLLPLALIAHWTGLAWVRHRHGGRRPTARPLVLMGLLGPTVLFVLWPWLWHDTLRRVRDYLAFHWHHVHYEFEYLGRNYSHPPYPWHEPLGMLLFTAPVILLALALAGIGLLCRPLSPLRSDADACSTRTLMLFAGSLPIAIFLAGTLPIYGGTKHWLATMPFLALCAGYAVDRLGIALERELGRDDHAWRGTAATTLLVLVVCAPAVVETWRSHPYGLSHYNALAGGAPGGADLGMNRQFWGYSVKGLLPWLNVNLPPRARLYLHDANHDAYELYVRTRQLRPDIVDAGSISASDAALVVHEKHFSEVDFTIWETYGHVQPAEVLTMDGVPLVSAYLRSPRR